MSEVTVITEFKSCPFCSSEKIKVEQMEQDNGIKVWVCWCGNCGSLGPKHLNWSGAIEMWNLRRSQKSLVDVLKQVKMDVEFESLGLGDLKKQINQALAQAEGNQS